MFMFPCQFVLIVKAQDVDMIEKLPTYLTTSKPIHLNVFGVIKDTLDKDPELLEEIKSYLKEWEEKNERMVQLADSLS